MNSACRAEAEREKDCSRTRAAEQSSVDARRVVIVHEHDADCGDKPSAHGDGNGCEKRSLHLQLVELLREPSPNQEIHGVQQNPNGHECESAAEFLDGRGVRLQPDRIRDNRCGKRGKNPPDNAAVSFDDKRRQYRDRSREEGAWHDGEDSLEGVRRGNKERECERGQEFSKVCCVGAGRKSELKPIDLRREYAMKARNLIMHWSRIFVAHAMCAIATVAGALTANAVASSQSSSHAVEASEPDSTAPIALDASKNVELRSTSISGGFAEITGLAVSPLMVMSLFGAVDWYRAVPGSVLPLHANPWVWGTLLTIFSIGLIARWTTRPVPMPIRKLFDAAHYLESKCSALLAAGLLLPYIASTMTQVGMDPNQVASTVRLDPQLALAGMPSDVLMYLAALSLFAVVWVVSHSIDALVLLSPFAVLDAALLSARATFLALLLGATALHPVLGALVALPIVIFCIFVAGWCVRLDIFAMTCAWDTLFRRWSHAAPLDGCVRAFIARPRAGLPTRTRGTIIPSGASMKFRYRRWFVMPAREVDLGVHPSTLVRGLLWSTFVAASEQGGGALVALPPRYQSHAAILAARFGAEQKDGLLLSGWSSVKEFLRTLFGKRPPTAAVQ